MKETLLIASLAVASLLLSATAVAGSLNAPSYGYASYAAPRIFTGFSVTGALGGIAGNTRIDQRAVIETSDIAHLFVNERFVYDLDLSETSFAGLIAVEYDYQFPVGLVLGLAVTAGFDNLEIAHTETEIMQQSFSTPPDEGNDTSTLTTDFKTKLQNDFALLFKPGFVVRRNTLLYALIGPRWGNFETRLTATANTKGSALPIGSPPQWNTTASDSDKTSGYQLGFTAGAGVQQALTDHFRLGIEYTYTHYANLANLKVSDAAPGTLESPAAGIVEAAVDDFNVVTNAVMLTVAYKY